MNTDDDDAEMMDNTETDCQSVTTPTRDEEEEVEDDVVPEQEELREYDPSAPDYLNSPSPAAEEVNEEWNDNQAQNDDVMSNQNSPSNHSNQSGPRSPDFNPSSPTSPQMSPADGEVSDLDPDAVNSGPKSPGLMDSDSRVHTTGLASPEYSDGGDEHDNDPGSPLGDQHGSPSEEDKCKGSGSPDFLTEGCQGDGPESPDFNAEGSLDNYPQSPIFMEGGQAAELESPDIPEGNRDDGPASPGSTGLDQDDAPESPDFVDNEEPIASPSSPNFIANEAAVEDAKSKDSDVERDDNDNPESPQLPIATQEQLDHGLRSPDFADNKLIEDGPASPDMTASGIFMEIQEVIATESEAIAPLSPSINPTIPDVAERTAESPERSSGVQSPGASNKGSGNASPLAGSPVRSRSGSVASGRGSQRSRSGSNGSRVSGRSRSGSRDSKMSGKSRSGSRASRASNRSRSGSKGSRASNRSRSGSQGSRASNRSRSGSRGSRISGRSRSGSRGSRGSNRSRSGSRSVASRGGSIPRSRSASVPRSRSPSPMSRASSHGSRRSHGSGARGASPISPNRSRDGSPLSPRHSRGASPMMSASHSNAGSRPSSRPASPAVSDAGSDVIGVKKRKANYAKQSDDEDSEKEEGVGELIADIFGPSDEEEEFEGFGADAETQRRKDKSKNDVEESGASTSRAAVEAERNRQDGSDSDVDRPSKDDTGMSDFDAMLQRKKDENRKRRRKRKDVDIINDNDDLIDAMVKDMKTAAEDDRTLNQARKPAVKKLKMLPEVVSQLKKSDLHASFLDGGILNAMTEWLAPLPDKSLPHLQIREAMLRQLMEFPQISTEGLKLSGIGKAVMYLCKHPKEIRSNKEIAGKLINEWSRPIFNLTSNYKNLSKEEREQRDIEQLPKKRRISMEGGQTPGRDISKAMAGDDKGLRPGDPGYVMRARVPMPSTKDYVFRPKWTVEEKPKGGSGKKAMTKLDKCMRQYMDKKRKAIGFQQAVPISIEGRNMSL